MTVEKKQIESLSITANRRDESSITHFLTQHPTDISAQFEPYRRELLLHCYRLLGSLFDAEDTVQETMLRAWQRFETFRGAASVRTWLYAIATNVCLDTLKQRAPRTLPFINSPASDPAKPVATKLSEMLWLEPFPDDWLAAATENPEARYTRAESVSLAFLTVLQLLPPRQRAILILADVLDWHAAEIARLLEFSVAAVNSALHRARVTLTKHYQIDQRELEQMHQADAATNTLLARYLHAWESDDVAGLVELLKEDAILSMPPIPSWYQGREAIRAFLLQRFGERYQWRMFPTRANAQPAFVIYKADGARSRYHAFGIQVISFNDSPLPRQIAAMTIFRNPSLVPAFGFPPQLA